jgi:hypothetical protein
MWLFRKRNPERRVEVKQEHESFIKAHHEILIELFADRGMLLGSSRYDELTGVERFDALYEIDNRIIQIKELIEKEELRCKKILKSL